MQTAEMRAADFQVAGMPLKAIVPASPEHTPQEFRLKWQSAMSLTKENPASQTGAVSTEALSLAHPPDSKVENESKEKADVLATPAGRLSKQKHDGKAACAQETARGTTPEEKLQPGSCDAATQGSQEIVAAIGPDASASAWPDENPKSGPMLNVALPCSSPPQAESRTSGKAPATPQAIVGVTSPSTGSTASRSLIDPGTRHAGQYGSAAPGPAGVHVSVNAPNASSTAIPHASLTASPNAGSPVGLAIAPSPSAARLSLRLDHAVAQSAGIADRQIVAAGPSHLDVGVFDGTHGWLRIRAELDTGGSVNAALTASASAHSSLKSALPEMVSYLSSEAVGVSKIAVHRFDAANSTTAGTSEEGGAGVAHGSHSGRDSEARKPHVGKMETANSPSEATMMIGAPWSPGFLAGMTGGWLNVCA
jgi:hypothetical protein